MQIRPQTWQHIVLVKLGLLLLPPAALPPEIGNAQGGKKLNAWWMQMGPIYIIVNILYLGCMKAINT